MRYFECELENMAQNLSTILFDQALLKFLPSIELCHVVINHLIYFKYVLHGPGILYNFLILEYLYHKPVGFVQFSKSPWSFQVVQVFEAAQILLLELVLELLYLNLIWHDTYKLIKVRLFEFLSISIINIEDKLINLALLQNWVLQDGRSNYQSPFLVQDTIKSDQVLRREEAKSSQNRSIRRIFARFWKVCVFGEMFFQLFHQ